MMRKALPILLLSLCACGGQAETPAADTSAGAPAAESTAPAPVPPQGDAAPGPISSRGEVVAGDPSQQGSGLTFDFPQGWTQEPASGMRMAQATIPGSSGPGSLTVFFFGPGGGGGVEANIQRWIDQVETTGQARQETFETSNGYRVTWVDVAGTLKPSMMGTGPTEPQPNSRLLGAVVEGPGGPWFFKATGPDATLSSQRDAFLGMLRSVRPESTS